MCDGIPINARLHASLAKSFGEVHVSNEGERFVGRLVPDPIRGGMRMNVTEPGEQYVINCPFCNDARKRLYISHKWNSLDEHDKVFGRWLLHCFNEDCFRIDGREMNWERIRELEDMLKPYVSNRQKVVRRPGEAYQRDVNVFKEMTLPGVCVPLNSLPDNHVARHYIEDRKFSVDELSTVWGLHYCERHEHPYIKNRIIIPIYNDGKLVGWQARAIGDKADGPKYFTAPGLKKARMLFNSDRARKVDFAVIVEGVFDAFRVGSERAVALLGKSMNTCQQKLVHRWWNHGAICLLLDPDAVEDMERISKLLSTQAYRWGAFSVLLPENNDPADMKREDLWEIIVNYARNRGIKIIDCSSGSGCRSPEIVSGK